MKNVTRALLCTSLAVLSSSVHADVILNLADPNGAGTAPATTSGTINGAIFTFGQISSSGTGVWNSFLRIQSNSGSESGYNTDSSNPPFDTKKGTWTHSVRVSDLPVVSLNNVQYFEYLLDINEAQGASGRISLDQFQIYQGSNPNSNSTDLTSLGTLVFNMDAGMAGNTVLMNTFNSGSGAADYSVLVPIWANADPNQYMTLFTQMGAFVAPGGTPSYESDGGFEEWAFDSSRPTFVPEPGAFSFLVAVAVWGLHRRRRES